MKCDFEANVTEADVRELIRWQLRPQIVVWIAMSIFAAFFVTLFAWEPLGGLPGALAVPIVMVLFLPFAFRSNVERAVRKQFRALAREQPMKMSVDNEGIRIITTNSDGRVDWAVFSRFVELPHSLALRMRNTGAVIIPKSALTDSQLEELRSFLSLAIGKKVS